MVERHSFISLSTLEENRMFITPASGSSKSRSPLVPQPGPSKPVVEPLHERALRTSILQTKCAAELAELPWRMSLENQAPSYPSPFSDSLPVWSLRKPSPSLTPVEIMRAVARQELVKLELEKGSTRRNGDAVAANTDKGLNRNQGQGLVFPRKVSNCDEQRGVRGRRKDIRNRKPKPEDMKGMMEKRNYKRKDVTNKQRSIFPDGATPRARPRKQGISINETSPVLKAEMSIVTNFIAKVKAAKKRKSFGTTYHVIKPRAHLYLPYKYTKPADISPDAKPNVSMEKSICEESPEFKGYCEDCDEVMNNCSKLASMTTYVDEQLKHHLDLSGRWNELLKATKGNPRLGTNRSYTSIKKMLRLIKDKNMAISKSLLASKTLIKMIQSHKHKLIQVARDWNDVHLSSQTPLE